MSVGCHVRSGALVVLLLSVVISPDIASPESGDQEPLRLDGWRGDLEQVYEKLIATHPDPFTRVTRHAFDSAFRALRDNLVQMDDDEIRVNLVRLLGMIGDGHTRIHGARLTELWYPVRIERFSDGLFVTAVSPEYRDLLGAEVLKIGAHPAGVVFDSVGSIISADNQYGRDYFTPAYITMVSIMAGLHLTDSPDALRLVIRHRDGDTVSVGVSAGPYASDDFLSWFWHSNGVPAEQSIRPIDVDPSGAVARWTNRDKNYWYTYIDTLNTVYFAFNQCQDAPNETFADFNTGMWDFIDTHDVGTLIIDLRDNLGGTNSIVMPLIYETIKHEKINTPGHLFVVVGRKTWSAALHCATWLERHTHAVFVGEPTASPPNHFADPKTSTLPHSGLLLMVSRYQWQNGWPWDDRPWIEPEIRVDPASDDYFRLTDPVLDSIRAFRAR